MNLNIFNFSKQEKFAIALMIALGFACIPSGIYITKDIKSEFWGDVVFAIGAILLADSISHILLSKSIRKETTDIFIEQLEKASPEVIKQLIAEKLDTNYRNLNDMGIANAYHRLDTEKRKKNFANAKTEILLLKIWIHDLDSMISDLVKAVNRGIPVTIILLDPTEAYTIEKRAEQTFNDADFIKMNIEQNIRLLKEVYSGNRRELAISEDKKSLFNVYTHNSFVSASIIRIDQTFYVGFYLYGGRAMDGVILKIRSNHEEVSFFKKIEHHCITQKEIANKVEL